MVRSGRLLESSFVSIWTFGLMLFLLNASAHAQTVRPVARCVEYANSGGSDPTYIAYFDYVSDLGSEFFIPPNTGDNFFTPVPSVVKPLRLFAQGYHPDAVKLAVSRSSGNESWVIYDNVATVSFPQDGSSQSGSVTPTCPVTIIAPSTLTFSKPGAYTHQYLGQVDSGPGKDSINGEPAIVTTVQAFVPAGAAISFSNLQYVPNDPSNPANSLNPNSIYGDVTVAAGPRTTTGVRLQLSVNGESLGRGTSLVSYTGPEAVPAPAIVFSVPNHTFGDPSFPVQVTSNSSGALTYSVVSGPATLNDSTVTLTGAGTVTLQASQAEVPGSYLAATQRATFLADKASAKVTLGNLSQAATGFPLSAITTTTPTGLAVSTTYNGSAILPVAAGAYTVSSTVSDANYQGSATGTLNVSGPVAGTIILTAKSQVSLAADGGYKAVITVTNSGTGTAQSVQLTTATLGIAVSAALPLFMGNLSPAGGSVTVTLSYPASIGTAGSTIAQKLVFTYTSGTSTTSGRITLPSR